MTREPIAAWWWLWSATGWGVAALYVTWTPGHFPIAPISCGACSLFCVAAATVNTAARLRHRPRHAARRGTTPR